MTCNTLLAFPARFVALSSSLLSVFLFRSPAGCSFPDHSVPLLFCTVLFSFIWSGLVWCGVLGSVWVGSAWPGPTWGTSVHIFCILQSPFQLHWNCSTSCTLNFIAFDCISVSHINECVHLLVVQYDCLAKALKTIVPSRNIQFKPAENRKNANGGNYECQMFLNVAQ